jgi:phosphoglycerate dehydrogenase-like enzyme
VSGKLGGLGLDVFEQEPLVDSPLLGLPRVVFTPHTGAHTTEAVRDMGLMAVKNLISVLTGAHTPCVIK